jgi:hypothetical protein
MCDKTKILTPFHLTISDSDCFPSVLGLEAYVITWSPTSYWLEVVAVITSVFNMSFSTHLHVWFQHGAVPPQDSREARLNPTAIFSVF